MKSRHAEKLMTCALALLGMQALPLAAAEVRGTVSVDYQGLFAHGDAASTHLVSVALLPAAGQRTARRTANRQTIEIVDNRMQPAFMTVQQGDSVEFINHDNVYHELFSLSSGKPLQTRLGKAGDYGRDRAVFKLNQAGTIHFFCRIHNKSYARIEVVDTPYIQMVEPGGSFDFTGIAPGRWRLRLTAPSAETGWVEVSAVTSPPPLQLTLKSHGGGTGRSGPGQAADVELLYRRLAGDGGAP